MRASRAASSRLFSTIRDWRSTQAPRATSRRDCASSINDGAHLSAVAGAAADEVVRYREVAAVIADLSTGEIEGKVGFRQAEGIVAGDDDVDAALQTLASCHETSFGAAVASAPDGIVSTVCGPGAVEQVMRHGFGGRSVAQGLACRCNGRQISRDLATLDDDLSETDLRGRRSQQRESERILRAGRSVLRHFAVD